jgi:hypothetical protein
MEDNTKNELDKYLDLYVEHCSKNIFELFPKKNDAQVADAILEIFRNRENLEIFNKKALYIYIREIIDVKTPKITKISNELYDIFKTNYIFYLENGYAKFYNLFISIFITKINMGSLDSVVFGKKKFSDILGEIYDNQKRKEKQISGLIAELKPLINDIGDATLIVPLIKEYLEIGVKNDEQLIKMSTIVQRALNSSSGEESLGITEEEKQELLKELDKITLEANKK